MKTLYLPIIETGTYHDRALANKRGLYNALLKCGEVHQFDYLAVDIPNLYAETAKLVTDFQPDLLLMQLHGHDRLTPQNLADLHALKPDMKIVNWNGDVYLNILTSPEMLELLKQVDLQLVVNAAALPIYEANGIKAHYWLSGYEEPTKPLPLVPAYDVLFLGNNYSEKRTQLGKVLEDYCNSRGLHLGLFGGGWPNHQHETVYDFAQGAALYRACKVAISDNQYPDAPGAFSNRLLQALAAGAFVLHQHTDGIQAFAKLIPGTHFIEWRNAEELHAALDYWLADNLRLDRARIAAAGQRMVLDFHSFDVRVQELTEWLKA